MNVIEEIQEELTLSLVEAVRNSNGTRMRKLIRIGADQFDPRVALAFIEADIIYPAISWSAEKTKTTEKRRQEILHSDCSYQEKIKQMEDLCAKNYEDDDFVLVG